MTSKEDKLREIVKQIQKMAKPFKPGAARPTQPAQPAPVVNTGGKPSPLPTHGGQPGGNPALPTHGGRAAPVAPTPRGPDTSPIIKMQEQLQSLAQAVSAQINLQDAFSGEPNKEKDAKARDAFGVFLTKNYMRNSKVPGVEYDPDPNITDVSQKKPDDPTRMSIVMDSMNRVGNAKKGERFADGKWGPRTNAAVRNAYAFASGLLDFVDDVNRFATKPMQIQSYDRNKLKTLEPLAQVDPNALNFNQKLRAAPVVAEQVKDIHGMYDEVKANILEHPAYAQFINGQTPFKTYKPKVSPEQLDALRKQFPQGFQIQLGPSGNRAQLNVDNLVSMDALNKWISQFPADKLTPQGVIDQVWKQNKQLLPADNGV